MLPERHDAMTTDANGTSGSPDQVDLDRLIGELETEAARRRAEPGYPHDADARLHFADFEAGAAERTVGSDQSSSHCSTSDNEQDIEFHPV